MGNPTIKKTNGKRILNYEDEEGTYLSIECSDPYLSDEGTYSSSFVSFTDNHLTILLYFNTYPDISKNIKIDIFLRRNFGPFLNGEFIGSQTGFFF